MPARPGKVQRGSEGGWWDDSSERLDGSSDAGLGHARCGLGFDRLSNLDRRDALPPRARVRPINAVPHRLLLVSSLPCMFCIREP